MTKKINNFKHREKIDRKKLHYTYMVAFLMGFSTALLSYVISTYLKNILGTDSIGFVYLIAYSIVLVLLLNLHKIIRVFGKSFALQVAFVFKIIAVSGMLFYMDSFYGVIFLMIYVLAGTIAWASLDGIIESFSRDSESGRIRGAHLAIMNAGFMMGPFISSQLLDKYGFSGVFSAALISFSIVFIAALLGIRKTNHRFVKKIKALDALKKVSKRKNIMRIYYLSFVLEIFYALAIIYVPIYLLGKGFTWDQLGVAFTIMLIPFVLIQYPTGVLADKRTGEKEFLFFSFLILGFSTLMLYLSDSPNIMVWTTILLLGRIGAALVEILRESYFYKRIDGNDIEIIDFFKTARPVAYIAAAVLSSLILVFSDVRSIFLALAIICFSAIYPTFKLVDNKCEKEILCEVK